MILVDFAVTESNCYPLTGIDASLTECMFTWGYEFFHRSFSKAL